MLGTRARLRRTIPHSAPATSRGPSLVRDLGLWGTAAVVVGVMIGTGIYLSPTEMARQAGSTEMVMLAWIVGGFLALLGSLTFSELAATFPETGGSYAYLRRAFGPLWGFLYGWRGMMVSTPASLASYAAGIMLFLGFLWPGASQPFASWYLALPFRETPVHLELRWSQVLGAFLILAFAGLNHLRVRSVGRLQVGLTLAKVVALLAVIGVGLWVALGLGAGSASPQAPPPTVRPPSLGGFIGALTAALWAYSGWQQVVRIGGEVRDPGRTFPRAILGGFLFTAALYLVVNLGYFAVLSFDGVARSEHVASDMLRQVAGSGVASWLTVAMIITVLGTMNGTLLSASRVPYAMARDGLLFPSLARVHPERRVPTTAVTVVAVMGVLFVLTGTFADLSALMVFASWTFYSLATLALFRLRRTQPDLPRPFRVWGYPVVPALFLVFSVALSVGIFLQRPVRSGLGIAIILAGIPFYLRWSRRPAAIAARLDDSASVRAQRTG